MKKFDSIKISVVVDGDAFGETMIFSELMKIQSPSPEDQILRAGTKLIKQLQAEGLLQDDEGAVKITLQDLHNAWNACKDNHENYLGRPAAESAMVADMAQKLGLKS